VRHLYRLGDFVAAPRGVRWAEQSTQGLGAVARVEEFPCAIIFQSEIWLWEFQNKFAQRYGAQVCSDRVRWPSQLRNSDMPGAIQTNSSGRRWG